MYCPFCGFQWPTLYKFCSSCGQNVSFVLENAPKPAGEDKVSCQAVPRVTDACAVPGKSASAVLQFMKYRELKETERKTFSKNKKISDKPVKISVGIMNKTKNGLRPMRGKNLPVHVDPQWSSEQLLAAALKKQKDFNQDMEDGEYVLLYPDGSQIKNIPGTDTPFTIGKYKEAIGKAYQRITLYICTLEDLLSKSQDDSVSEEDEVVIRAQPNMSPLSDTVLWSSPESSTPERRHGAYTHIFAPITIDSSSSDLEEVEKLPEKDSDGHDGLTAADIVSNLAHNLNKTSCSRFNINRANVWDGGFRGFRRSSFDPTCSMMVKFTDDAGLTEEALDSGGPTREFLTLLMDSIKTRRVFEGKDNAKYLSFDSKAAEDNEYFHIGRMIAVSIVHGGPGPRCLSPNLFLYLIGKVKTLEAPIEDIPDDEVKRGLLEIKNATSLSKLQELTEKYSSMLQTAGCYRFMKTLEDKKKVVDDYIQWYFIYRNHVSIQRFKEGLATLDFVNALEQHPSLFFSFMCYTETKLTADAVENIFHVQFSQPGSTNRQEEARVLSYWRDYLLYLEEKEASPSLEDVLMFGTGLKEVPPAAIQPQPQLVFQKSARFPMANVCTNTIKIPILSRYEDFQEAMDYGMQNSPGFGLP
ncbi:G2/M phase-specific E3 ubiquitin-protein ligase-like isoform X1 [Paramormyrops kingsleyae]|uniref:G2/M phase-specific E3 ubiquitin-protein ligase-like isoform X1 n=2 Tax=Paramormyrops kingsleyae TaxID=1676925 RepID=UPI003B97A045